MNAEIIAIGSELLSGKEETNSAFLAERLSLLGIELRSISIVGNNEEVIAEMLRNALKRSDLIIMIGGLGPAEDDLTRKTIAKVSGKRLVLQEDILDRIKDYFREMGREMPKNAERQALIPSGAKVIENPVGSVPGFFLEHLKGLILCLPGQDRELRRMFISLEPILKQRYGGKWFRRLKVIRTCGLYESWIDQNLKDIQSERNGIEIGMVATDLGIDIRITGRGSEERAIINSMELVEERIRKRLGDYIYGTDEESLEEVIGRLLREKGIRLSVAESCTGGLIAHRITNLPKSSDYFERGIVCYSNKSKVDLLNVPSRLIEEYGSVSKEVAIAMAEGVRSVSKTYLGLSTTGIAGPTVGIEHEGRPIGLVYMALASPEETRYREYRFISDREGIKRQASQMALDMIRRYLINL